MQSTIFFVLRPVVVGMACLHAFVAASAGGLPGDTVDIAIPDADTQVRDDVLGNGVQPIHAESYAAALRANGPAHVGSSQRREVDDFTTRYIGTYPRLESEVYSLAGGFPSSQGVQVCGCWDPDSSSIALEPHCTSGVVRPNTFEGFCPQGRPRYDSVLLNRRLMDTNRFLSFLRSRALPLNGASTCARHVREALEAAGLDSTGHPASAKDWGPTLFRMGFTSINPFAYQAARGDVVVFRPGLGHPNGHIQAFDGTSWISDFVQPHGFWPSPTYRHLADSFTPYRYAREYSN